MTVFPAVDLRLPSAHQAVLTAALRAPSAHNAQPWRLVAADDGQTYEVHYDHHDYLPLDPDDRDACLAMGAFVENLALAADREGLDARVTPVLQRHGADLDVARVRLRPARAGHVRDPLAPAVGGRHTNRQPYRSRPLEPALAEDLIGLGCRLVPPAETASLVREASLLSWGDRRFVADLATWMRWDTDVEDGLTPDCLCLTAADRMLLRLALRLGRLPRWAAAPYAARDVRLLRSAPAVAVLTAADKRLSALFDAGRRLLRCWVTICAAGAAYHPISIAIDVPSTAARLDEQLGQTAVAMFRIGYPEGPVPLSPRRALSSVLRPPVRRGSA